MFVFVLAFAAISIPLIDLQKLQFHNYFWLGLSGMTTALSWVFYYKALKMGDVATVALIDKGSVVVAMFLAWLMLKEAITLRLLIGATFILIGLLVIDKK